MRPNRIVLYKAHPNNWLYQIYKNLNDVSYFPGTSVSANLRAVWILHYFGDKGVNL